MNTILFILGTLLVLNIIEAIHFEEIEQKLIDTLPQPKWPPNYAAKLKGKMACGKIANWLHAYPQDVQDIRLKVYHLCLL